MKEKKQGEEENKNNNKKTEIQNKIIKYKYIH